MQNEHRCFKFLQAINVASKIGFKITEMYPNIKKPCKKFLQVKKVARHLFGTLELGQLSTLCT